MITDHPEEVAEPEEESNVGHMEEEALKRRQRIQELRNKRKLPGDAVEAPATSSVQEKTKLLPNYTPADATLKDSTLPSGKPENVADHIQDVLESAHDEPHADDIDLTKLAPRKVDWDLKRNIAKKLEKLERRTQIAIAELIRERILASGIENLDQATEDLESANRNLNEDVDD
ncbi:PREDICTED: coiled-coil domain-containing protein 12-like [Rhagoletis zephyria]|uniref:coiled-coil domain-containing protein 12-like n=1 Tax=Rhagoletis zephyria TaxID=28612 RepID=UPI00081169F2|nr:PREDICTED: coiled-coil domain-containing protein 12-like [Rhagoletis zephyria]